MNIYKGRLDKDEVLQVPQQERRFFLTITHIQNEINILLRAVLWSSDYSSENEAEVQGQISTSLFFVKLLAGKLKEGWTILNKSFFSDKSLSSDFRAHATPEQIDHLDELSRYFGKTNLLHEVRTDFAFHYSPSELDDVLPTVSDELDLYIEQDGNANTLYYFAEVLANRAIISRIDASDEVEALKRLRDEVVMVSGHFTRFGQAFMSYVIKRHSPSIWKDTAIPISFKKLLSFSKIRFPWFADTTGGLWRKNGIA